MAPERSHRLVEEPMPAALDEDLAPPVLDQRGHGQVPDAAAAVGLLPAEVSTGRLALVVAGQQHLFAHAWHYRGAGRRLRAVVAGTPVP